MTKQQLRKYAVTVDVTDVYGSQTFSVLANTASEALEKFKSGGYIQIIDQSLEVTNLSRCDHIVEEVDSHDIQMPIFTKDYVAGYENQLHDMTHKIDSQQELINEFTEENEKQIAFLRKFITVFPVNSSEAMEVSKRIDALTKAKGGE